MIRDMKIYRPFQFSKSKFLKALDIWHSVIKAEVQWLQRNDLTYNDARYAANLIFYLAIDRQVFSMALM